MQDSPVIIALQQLSTQIDCIETSDCPALIGILEQLKAQTWAKMMSGWGDTKPEPKLTIQQVAERLNIPDSCAYELARQGKIKSVRVGKYIRVPEAALKEYEGSLGQKKP